MYIYIYIYKYTYNSHQKLAHTWKPFTNTLKTCANDIYGSPRLHMQQRLQYICKHHHPTLRHVAACRIPRRRLRIHGRHLRTS